MSHAPYEPGVLGYYYLFSFLRQTPGISHAGIFLEINRKTPHTRPLPPSFSVTQSTKEMLTYDGQQAQLVGFRVLLLCQAHV